MSGLVLLASYPKSGSTWMRAFLGSLAQGGRTPNINSELAAHVLTARRIFDVWLGVEASDLTSEEIARGRPYASRRVAETNPGLIKAHDANLVPPGAREPPYPADSIDRVVYIVRDPRDVAVSFAHHMGITIRRVVDDMNDLGFSIGQSRQGLNRNVEQYLSTWSRHVESWLDSPNLRVHCVRYEDMSTTPLDTFSAAVKFLELGYPDDLIAKAIDAVHFPNLAQQEGRVGFSEKLSGADAPFFRQGQLGRWRDSLSPALAAQIERDHEKVMRRLAYLQ